MRKFILAALLCAAGSSFAQTMIARQGSDSVRLYDKPCHAEVAAIVPEAKDWRAALAVVGGQPYKACWTVRSPVVFMRYEDGDMGSIPVELFKQDDGA